MKAGELDPPTIFYGGPPGGAEASSTAIGIRLTSLGVELQNQTAAIGTLPGLPSPAQAAETGV